MAFFAGFCGFFELIGTIGLHQLLLFLQRSQETKLQAWFSIMLFSLCPIIRGLCMQTFEYFATHTIGDWKALITTAVYRKLLVLHEDADIDVGQLQSNISADIDRLGTLRYTAMTVFMAPVEFIVSSVLLYKIMGWYYLPSLAFLLITRYPLSKFIVSAQSGAQSKILQAADRRITKTSESIRAMSTIKILGHVQPFIRRILNERDQELKAIWSKMQVIVTSESLSSACTFLALILCLALYTIIGKKPLEADIVFTVVAVFNIVKGMLTLSVLGAGQYAQATVSLKRLSDFLDRPESEVTTMYAKDDAVSQAEAGSRHPTTVTVQSCAVPGRLSGNSDAELVQDGLNVVTGELGSGKTLLLQSLLGGRKHIQGVKGFQRSQFEPIGYVPQNPWIYKGSIRDNIIFGAPFDPERYENIIRSCALEPDFASFKDGDLKDVGEGGRRLSGGQRQRVALARAAYSHAKIVILDDILSGLDPATTNWVIDKCILGPQMKGRTLVLVTNNTRLLDLADLNVHTRNGAVFQTTTARLLSSGPAVSEERSAVDSSLPNTLNSGEQNDSVDENQDSIEESENFPDGEDGCKGGLIGLEYMCKYIRSFGGWPFIMIVAMFTIFAQIMEIILPTWLSLWSRTYMETKRNSGAGFYVTVFAGLGIVQIFILAISLVLMYSGSWRASRDKHLQMLTAAFGATYAWIWRTPAGQIINRFSSDIASLDDTLFKTFRPVIETYLSIGFRIITVSSLIPLFLLPSIALTGVAIYIGYRYRFASTAVKHMYAASLSPLHHSITETVSGLTTIHAFRAEKMLQDRFATAIEHHVRTWRAVSDLQRWLAVRMDICIALISFSVAVLAVTRQHANASAVGLSLTLTTGLCTALLYLVYLSSLLEVEMTSYYRIESYIKGLPQEPSDLAILNDTIESWPTHGVVDVQNLTAGYSLDEDEVLKDISFRACPGERVAIVGRTGSGKSSMALSLLRLTIRLHGSINVDGVDIESLDVDRLRQHISLIPQDPTLFDGTIRFNLDMNGAVSDEHLQGVLDDVAGASKWKLDDVVEANGKNFSRGERQLIALARAMVTKNKVLIMDEGTASLDPVSEERIHAVLRAKFNDWAVIAITHRLHNIVDFDQVLVLDKGRVTEQGKPRQLLNEGQGPFWALYMQQGVHGDR
ncbi:hypothetical protein MW887_001352 [Aspergillus wentii]|nr:hypothetical protein MW887_001352 [Aspergillus wentii]